MSVPVIQVKTVHRGLKQWTHAESLSNIYVYIRGCNNYISMNDVTKWGTWRSSHWWGYYHVTLSNSHLMMRPPQMKLRVTEADIKMSGSNLASWWRHQMETFSALLAICVGNASVTCEFPTQRPVTRIFDVFLDRRLTKRLNNQSRLCWLETPSCSLWRHCNGMSLSSYVH